MRPAHTVIVPQHFLEVVLSQHTPLAPPSTSLPSPLAKASAEALPLLPRGRCQYQQSALPQRPERAAVLHSQTPPTPLLRRRRRCGGGAGCRVRRSSQHRSPRPPLLRQRHDHLRRARQHLWVWVSCRGSWRSVTSAKRRHQLWSRRSCVSCGAGSWQSSVWCRDFPRDSDYAGGSGSRDPRT